VHKVWSRVVDLRKPNYMNGHGKQKRAYVIEKFRLTGPDRMDRLQALTLSLPNGEC
jgi:hypothetical protein